MWCGREEMGLWRGGTGGCGGIGQVDVEGWRKWMWRDGTGRCVRGVSGGTGGCGGMGQEDITWTGGRGCDLEKWDRGCGGMARMMCTWSEWWDRWMWV